ncbi:MAG: hemerythrin family protein [Magnetospirillum sp.]|nr:hemerythrin family protein [Magnetospirillum sp.]
MSIQWQDAMSIGVRELDEDHRALFDLVNDMERALALGDTGGVAEIMRDLVGLISEHFGREEAMLSAMGCPSYYSHRDSHDAVADRIHLLRRRYLVAEDDTTRTDIATALYGFINASLLEHILTDDSKLAKKLAPKAQDIPAAAAPPPPVSVPVPMPGPGGGDIEYTLPPNLAHLLARLNYSQPRLPRPSREHTSFEELCSAALMWRIDEVLVIFHKHNPSVSRDLPPAFILSPDFAARFKQAVEALIVPEMLKSRQLRLMFTRFDWTAADSESFWDYVDAPLADDLFARWRSAWDDLKLRERVKDDGSKVFQVKESTRILRDMLQPGHPATYDLARIGNTEIETFKSLFDPIRDLPGALNAAWQKCHDLYEQELEPRVFQQKAREGALRDYLLRAHHEYSHHWGEFLLLSCHQVFGRINTSFLERYSTSLGRTEMERVSHMPYLMRYLSQVREHPEIRGKEREEEAQWQAQRRELQNILKGITAAA